MAEEALTGKVVLVTGGAKRVGAAISRRLHAAGATVVLHYHSAKPEAQQLLAELNAARANSAAMVQANLLNSAELPELVRTAVTRYGQLDVLVNNASSFYATPLGEIKVSDWDDLVGTNLKAPLFIAQAAAAHLRKTGGCIVNITDIHAERPLKSYVVYSVAKAGLAALTRSLARELGPEVRVNGVAPGPVLWPEDDSFDELARQRVISHTLLKRAGEPADVAAAVYYLVADAPFVTGQIITVDGGRSVNL
jgi:pteridine reductase